MASVVPTSAVITTAVTTVTVSGRCEYSQIPICRTQTNSRCTRNNNKQQ